MAKHDYFSEENLRKDLKKKAVRGGIVTISARVLGILISLATVPILTRLLSPEDFGLIATVAVFTNFATMFVDAGLAKATIQRDSITHQQASNLFWVACSFGIIVASVVACLSPAVAWFYEEARLQPIMLALAVSYCFSGLTIQHQALLQRSMRFVQLSTADIGSSLTGQLVGIFTAYQLRDTSYAYWALVAMPITIAVVRCLIIWILTGWKPSLPKRNVGTRELVVFGANLTGFNFINYFSRNMDKLLISKWWGATQLGYYDRAYRLLLMPMSRLTPPVSQLVVPLLSRLKNEPEKYRKAYYLIIKHYFWMLLPLVGFLFVVSVPLVRLYFGEKWIASTVLFQALIPATWASSFISCTGWVYHSLGHVNRQFRWSIFNTIILLIVICSCLPYSPLAVCYGLSAGVVILSFAGMAVCFYGTIIDFKKVALAIFYPTISSLFAGMVGYYFLANYFADFSLLAKILATLAIYVAAMVNLFLVMPGSIKDLKSLKELVRNRRKT